jgi:ABC-type antimicrobial peptide transport system permease subunit
MELNYNGKTRKDVILLAAFFGIVVFFLTQFVGDFIGMLFYSAKLFWEVKIEVVQFGVFAAVAVFVISGWKMLLDLKKVHRKDS